MEVPKVVVNIGNPEERVHRWNRAHMVLINNSLVDRRSVAPLNWSLIWKMEGEKNPT